jgi:hypothetical protein
MNFCLSFLFLYMFHLCSGQGLQFPVSEPSARHHFLSCVCIRSVCMLLYLTIPHVRLTVSPLLRRQAALRIAAGQAVRWLAFTDQRDGDAAETYLLACSLTKGLLVYHFSFTEASALAGPAALAVSAGGGQLYVASAPDRALASLALGPRLDILGRPVSDFTFMAAASETVPPAVGPPPVGLRKILGVRVGQLDCGGYVVSGDGRSGQVLASGQSCEAVQVRIIGYDSGPASSVRQHDNSEHAIICASN